MKNNVTNEIIKDIELEQLKQDREKLIKYQEMNKPKKVKRKVKNILILSERKR